MNRPKRTSARRPADYSIAWWNAAGLEGLLPSNESEGTSTRQESERDRKNSATYLSERQVNGSISHTSSETDDEVNLSLTESESEMCGTLPENEIDSEGCDETAKKKGKSYNSRKGRHESEIQSDQRKRRRKTVQTPEKERMNLVCGTEKRKSRSEREEAINIKKSKGSGTGTSFIARSQQSISDSSISLKNDHLTTEEAFQLRSAKKKGRLISPLPAQSHLRPNTSSASARSPIFLGVDQYCKLILAAEHDDRGEKRLKKIVHMPLDPDILLWVFKAKHNFHSDAYALLNTRYDFQQVHTYAMDQAIRQIFYFSQMLHANVYTTDELAQKVGPYITAQTGKRVLARVMLSDGKSVMLTEERIKLTKDQYVQRFIQHCSDVDPAEAESEALSTGGPDIEIFIRTIKNFKKDSTSGSPYHKSAESTLPSVMYDVRHTSLPVTSKNRVGAEMMTSTRYARDTLAKRELFVRTEIHFAYEQLTQTFCMQRRALADMTTHDTRVKSLLMAYSNDQLLGILSTFLSQTKEVLSEVPLQLANKNERAAIPARLLLIPRESQLGTLHPRDFMDESLWSRIEKKRKQVSERWASTRHKWRGPRRKQIPTDRAFWQQRARRGLYREKIRAGSRDLPPSKEKVEDLIAHVRHLFEEQHRKCKTCSVHLTIDPTRKWTNGSIDRIVPGMKGGTYCFDNVQILCHGCNTVKYWYPLRTFRVLMGTLVELQPQGDESHIESVHITSPKPIGVLEMAKIVLPWCELKLRSTYAIKREKGRNWIFKAKRSTLKLSDILNLVKARWVGNGFVQEACGITVPLGLVGLDRIDPEGGYRVGNVRLLLTGLNLLKGDSLDDSRVIGYLNHLSNNKDVLREAQVARSQGNLLPLQRSTQAILNQAQVPDDDMLFAMDEDEYVEEEKDEDEDEEQDEDEDESEDEDEDEDESEDEDEDEVSCLV